MGHHAFFLADDGDMIDVVGVCLDLALLFHCDPYSFLERPVTEIAELARRTQKRLRQIRPRE